MTFADAWTGGIIGGTLAAIVILLPCVAAVCGSVVLYLRADGNPKDYLLLGGPFAAAAVATVVVWLWASWPLAYDYHHWVDKSGRVEQVSHRLVSDGDNGMFQKFVVVIEGSSYGIDDTRASLLQKGDMVRLRCKKAYQFGVPRAAHGWDCRWSS